MPAHQSILDLDESSGVAADSADAAAFLRSLANESRLAILCALIEGEHSVGQLQTRTGIAPSPLSQHLARLRKDGIVVTRRQAQTIYYSIAHPDTRRMLDLLHDIFCS